MSTRLDQLLADLRRAYDARRHRGLLEALWHEERWFDTPHQRRAAERAREACAAAGLADAALVPFAADGRTRYQDWTTHLAWDCPAAGLRCGDHILADRSACPTNVVYWSGPLAATTAPVIDADALPALTPDAIRGRFLLTARPPRDLKVGSAVRTALAVISDYLGDNPAYTPDTVKWCNTWADGPDGWYFRAGDSVLPGFCLSPRQGAILRDRLRRDPNLQLNGFCTSRLYAGAAQCVTAVLPGTDPSREIWLFGHACEQGANDNASGVSTIVEALAILSGLVAAGRLPRPRYSIRAIVTEECLGMLAFATQHPDLARRALAGLNVDSVGDLCRPDRPFCLHYGPLSSPSFGWAAALAIAAALPAHEPEYLCTSRGEPPTADDMIADPACGIPTAWLGRGRDSLGYHSSADTPAVCTESSLRGSTLLAAAWAYILSSVDAAWAADLCPLARSWTESDFLRAATPDAQALRRWAAGGMWRDLHRFGLPAAAYEPQAARYAPAAAPPLPDLAATGPRFTRRAWGTLTLEILPPAAKSGLSRWSAWQTSALYWLSAGHPLPAVERLVAAELGAIPPGALQTLVDAGLAADLVEPKGSVPVLRD